MIPAALQEFTELGFSTVPIPLNGKVPRLREWGSKSPSDLWYTAAGGHGSIPAKYATNGELLNVGIRGGGLANVGIFDCDSLAAFERVSDHLAELGITEYPLVQSASGIGRHIYVRFTGGLSGHAAHFTDAIGKGHFIYGPGSQAVAPGSVVNGQTYKILSGDLGSLPELNLAAVLPLLKNPRLATDAFTAAERVSLPKKARWLLAGKALSNYRSRSEAEAAVCLMAANAGYTFDETLNLFESYPAAGKFREQGERGKRWLKHTFDNAKAKADAGESPIRRQAEMVYFWALTQPWPGRTGSTDRAVFLAHCSVAHESAKFTYQASVRTLAERAHISRQAVGRANKRLIANGLIGLERAWSGKLANVYCLHKESLSVLAVTTSSQRKKGSGYTLPTFHEAFRLKGLGPVAFEVYTSLATEGPADSIAELARRTGRSRTGVRNALRRMQGLLDSTTGELIDIVRETSPRGYQAVVGVDFDLIAFIVGTAGSLRKQKEQHRIERERHRRDLLLGRLRNDADRK